MSDTTIVLDLDLALRVADVLRGTPTFVLLHTPEHHDQIAEDFKPHKFEGYEMEFAAEVAAAHRELMDELKRQVLDDEKTGDQRHER